MTEEFERLKEALKKPASKEAMEEAAQRFKDYEEAQKAKGKLSSKPTLVSLGYQKTYPNAIPVNKIPDELAKNPEFFELMKRVVAKERVNENQV